MKVALLFSLLAFQAYAAESVQISNNLTRSERQAQLNRAMQELNKQAQLRRQERMEFERLEREQKEAEEDMASFKNGWFCSIN